MTANQIKGKGFKGALRYNLEKVSRGVAEVLDYSFSDLSEKVIMKEVMMMKTKKPDVKKFFYHTSINFPPEENLSNAMMKQIANDYLQMNGFTQHQFIVVRHYDANHPHMHILVNRIGFDGEILSDSNDFARSEKVVRAIEIKHNLIRVKSSNQASRRAITKDEQEMMSRTGQSSDKVQLQAILDKILSSKRKLSTSEFIQALEKKGIHVRFNQASTGFVSGISYSYKGVTVKGAKLGNEYKWTTVREVIDYNQGRDRQLIGVTNRKEKSIQHEPMGDDAGLKTFQIPQPTFSEARFE